MFTTTKRFTAAQNEADEEKSECAPSNFTWLFKAITRRSVKIRGKKKNRVGVIFLLYWGSYFIPTVKSKYTRYEKKTELHVGGTKQAVRDYKKYDWTTWNNQGRLLLIRENGNTITLDL